jgi:hypothetical protein
MTNTNLSYFPANPYKQTPGGYVQGPLYRRLTAACGGRNISAAQSWLEFLYYESRACGLTQTLTFWLLFILAAFAVLAARPILATTLPTPPASSVTHSTAADNIKPLLPKQRPKIIATSDGNITITFTNCRENEKHHVSCQMTDADDDSHWVYLPGVKLPPTK